jgi:hypothetical protein
MKIVNLNEIGVMQSGEDSGLFVESFSLRLGTILEQALEGNLPGSDPIPGPIDLAHPAFSQEALDLVTHSLIRREFEAFRKIFLKNEGGDEGGFKTIQNKSITICIY